MKKRTQILLFFIAILLNACNAQTKQEQRLAAFKKQKHRFEFNKCNMYYNGQKIELYKPKKYYANIFGDNFFTEHKPYNKSKYHKEVPVFLNDRPRSIKKLKIRDIVELEIIFSNPDKEDKLYNIYKDIPILKKGEYILIDGIPFGHDVSFEELNQTLAKQGNLPFSNKFAGSYNIKARRFTNCENSPLFSISYSRKRKLQSFSYEIRKPKNLN